MTVQTMAQRLDGIDAELIPREYEVLLSVVRDAQQRMLRLVPPSNELPHPFDSGRISDEWLESIVEAQRVRADNERRRGVLATLVNDGNMRAAQLLSTATDDLLTAYQSELKRLLAEVSDLAEQLDGITTADAALRADRVAQWKELIRLADDHDTLRSRQLEHYDWQIKFESSPAIQGEPYASDLYLSNLDEIWPGWRNPQRTTIHLNAVGGAAERLEPWPADKTQLLLWLVRSPAKPWIPTHRQIQRLRQDRVARANPLPKAKPGQPDKPAARSRPTVRSTPIT